MESKPSSALTVALEAISDRWSLTVVRELAFGPRRFTDLAVSTAAPRDVLVARLRTLEANGIVQRSPYGSGKREQYSLTDKGVDLAEVVLVLKKWGDRYKPAGTATIELEHLACEGVFEARIHCASCGAALERGQLREHPVEGGH
jgi:DNA-binding HxlR family transcriptional regulator